MLRINIFIIIILSIISAKLYAEDKNPFIPYIAQVPELIDTKSVRDKEEFDKKNPLEKRSLKNYKLIGLMTSQKDAIALIKTMENLEFFVRVGDKLGNEGGKIEIIDSQGVMVNTGKKLVNLYVSNKLEVVTDNDK